MRKLVDDLRSQCESFLGQRDDLVLMVRAGPSEHLALTATLDGLDKQGSPDVFWLFAEPFETADQYVTAVTRVFQARCALLDARLADEGEPSLPSVPAEVSDPAATPVARMRALMEHARGLVPDLDAAHLVWGLLPGEIRDPLQFARFVLRLLRHAPPVPWCHHMRVVVRELASPALLHQYARAMPRARWYAPDLGTAAVERALDEEARDPALPLPQRMQSFFVLAGLDLTQRRLREAVRKYGLLSRYYNAVGDLPLCALSLNGLGEVADRIGRPQLARNLYERALTPALESKSLLPLINITLNLANLHRGQKRWSEAFDHYQAVSELAGACCNAPLRIRCLEQMGYCRHRLGDPKGAWEHWNAGKLLARGTGAQGELMACLLRLRALFAELAMRSHRKSTEQEIAELKRLGVKAVVA